MIYQLPSGKIINISIETFLRMSDDDFRYLSEADFGSSVSNNNPFDIIEDDVDDVSIVEDYPIEDIADDLDFTEDLD